MKRTTIFADDEIMKKLKEIAKRENSTVSEVTRKALNEFVSRRMRKRSRLSLIGIGRSGRKDVAERAEDSWIKGSAGNARRPRGHGLSLCACRPGR